MKAALCRRRVLLESRHRQPERSEDSRRQSGTLQEIVWIYSNWY